MNYIREFLIPQTFMYQIVTDYQFADSHIEKKSTIHIHIN